MANIPTPDWFVAFTNWNNTLLPGFPNCDQETPWIRNQQKIEDLDYPPASEASREVANLT